MYPVFTSTGGQSVLEQRLQEAQDRIDTLLRDEKTMAYPNNCDFMAISNSFADFSQSICSRFSGMNLDKCLQDVPLEVILSEPLEAIIQGHTVLCYEHINTCF